MTEAERGVVWWARDRRNNKDVVETRRRTTDDGIPDSRARAPLDEIPGRDPTPEPAMAAELEA